MWRTAQKQSDFMGNLRELVRTQNGNHNDGLAERRLVLPEGKMFPKGKTIYSLALDNLVDMMGRQDFFRYTRLKPDPVWFVMANGAILIEAKMGGMDLKLSTNPLTDSQKVEIAAEVFRDLTRPYVHVSASVYYPVACNRLVFTNFGFESVSTDFTMAKLLTYENLPILPTDKSRGLGSPRTNSSTWPKELDDIVKAGIRAKRAKEQYKAAYTLLF